MATTKPRINMALRPEFYDVVTRLARLQGRSRSAVVVELLEQAIPVLERVVVIGEAAARAQVEARKQLGDALEKAEAAVLPHVTAAMDQFDLLLPAPEPQERVGAQSPPLGAEGARLRGLSVAKRRKRALDAKPARKGGDPRPVTRGSSRGGKPVKKGGRKAAKTQ